MRGLLFNHSSLSDLLFSISRREVRRPFVSDYQTGIVLAPGVNQVASNDPVLRPLSLWLGSRDLRNNSLPRALPLTAILWAVLDHSFFIT